MVFRSFSELVVLPVAAALVCIWEEVTSNSATFAACMTFFSKILRAFTRCCHFFFFFSLCYLSFMSQDVQVLLLEFSPGLKM